MRPSGIPNPALPEGGSTGTGTTNGSSTVTQAANVSLIIRSSCNGGHSSMPSSVIGIGAAGAAEVLVKELISIHPDPQKLTRAILNASSSYSNITNVQVSSANKSYAVKVPSELTNDELKNWLKLLCVGVGCCVGMIEIDTGEAAGRPCTLCGESTSDSVTSAAITKRPNVETESKTGEPSTKTARVSPERPEVASSTTGAPPPPPPSGAAPADWTVEHVIGFIAAADAALAAHADLFRKHEIDGKALLLLNSDMMMKYMGLKLGPALKICNLVSKIKNRRHYST